MFAASSTYFLESLLCFVAIISEFTLDWNQLKNN